MTVGRSDYIRTTRCQQKTGKDTLPTAPLLSDSECDEVSEEKN